ncbi:MAG: uroporphyrinogen decarboxylase family protein [Anaerolineae bacterium]
MRGECVPVPFIAFFGPWEETLARWRREGLGDRDWAEAAGFEDGSQHPVPVNAYLCPLFPEVTLIQDGATRTVRDKHGITKRISRGSESMPQFLRHPVESREDWQRLKPRLSNPDHPKRFPHDWEAWKASWAGRDSILFLGMLPCGFFGALRELMGLERTLVSFYQAPALVEEILDTLCELWLAFYPRVLQQVQVDFVFIWEDMCYRSGPLISPATFRRFLLPRYRRLTAGLRSVGVENISVDSDGDVTQLIPLWLEGGINGVQPFEIASGLDLLAIARQYPDLQMIGGVDKRALAAGPAAIDQELAKLPSLLERGRYIPAVDHGVPSDVSWDNYRYFAEQLRRLLEV